MPGLATDPRTAKSRVSPKWALGYLSGRAQAFRKGNVCVSDVAGSVGLALRYGVPPPAITATLAVWQLTWDRATGIVKML